MVNSRVITNPNIEKLPASSIRVKARALIMRDKMVLCQKKRSGHQIYMSLPGGTQEFNESLEQTLMRECAEEIGTTVIPSDLAFVIAHNRSFSGSKVQKLECIFTATVASDYIPKNGPQPDENQLDILWVHVDDLSNHIFMPPNFADALQMRLKGKNQLYWSLSNIDEDQIAKIIQQ